jgi:hypothetical protein
VKELLYFIGAFQTHLTQGNEGWIEMKILVLIALLFIGMIFFLFGNSYADSIKEEHKLQERCDEGAEKYFKRFYGSGYYKSSEGTSLYHYISHHNRKLNKCFVLLTGQLSPQNMEEMEKHGITTDKELWDINENQVYGWFLKFDKFKKPVNCGVSGKHCNSESEWDSLVKPYMEE